MITVPLRIMRKAILVVNHQKSTICILTICFWLYLYSLLSLLFTIFQHHLFITILSFFITSIMIIISIYSVNYNYYHPHSFIIGSCNPLPLIFFSVHLYIIVYIAIFSPALVLPKILLISPIVYNYHRDVKYRGDII